MHSTIRTPLNFRRCLRIASLIFLVWIPNARPQTKDIFSLSCLTPEQVTTVVTLIAKLKTQLRLDSLIEAHSVAMAAKDALFETAMNCNDRMQRDPFSAFSAALEGCPATIRRYNSLVDLENSAESRLRTTQEVIIRQVLILIRNEPQWLTL